MQRCTPAAVLAIAAALLLRGASCLMESVTAAETWGGRRLQAPSWHPRHQQEGDRYQSEEPEPVVELADLGGDGFCGDGKCEPPETAATCMADCPGVTTQPQCGEEPHSDPGGHAVVWGASHKVDSAAECCERCAAHAEDPKNADKPCNSWVFCHTLPYCWSLDTGNWHGFGECWLKWQADPEHPLYGQRGQYAADFRKKHARAHKTGKMPDGSPRNLDVPTHVPWTGGIMGRVVDHSVKWTTSLKGMTSSAGDSNVEWRAWESREQNLARGVRPESIP